MWVLPHFAWKPMPAVLQACHPQGAPEEECLSLALSFSDGGTYGCQADQSPRLATTQSAEEPECGGAFGQPGGLRPSTVMLKVRTSVINGTFDGDHAAMECWSPASVSESSMITPTFSTVST